MSKRFRLIFLGCPKNLVDTEHLCGELLEKGFKYSEKGEYVFIQTCAFIQPAIEESYRVIERFAEKKKKGSIKFIGVGGCLPLRVGEKIKKDFPEVDVIFSNLREREIIPRSPRFFLTKGYAYVKISEGCDEKCSFCTIPRIRGKFRSRSMEDIIAEIEFLVNHGFKEIVLISQSTGQYGKDIYGKPQFKELLKKIEKIKGDFWVRVMYMHPADVDRELVKIFKGSEKIVNYMDIPVQHFSERVLKNMRRRGGKKKVIGALEMIRENFGNDFYIRSEIITGFPGEGKRDFEELVHGIKTYNIQRIAIFRYSEEKGAYAERFKKLPEDVVQERFLILEKMARDIMRKNQENLMGKSIRSLIFEEKDKFYIARTPFDAPEVDFQVYAEKRRKIDIPGFYTLKIKSVKRTLDLKGEIC